jgi:hypothetical protein
MIQGTDSLENYDELEEQIQNTKRLRDEGYDRKKEIEQAIFRLVKLLFSGLDLTLFSTSELELLGAPLDLGRFPEEIRRMIFQWLLVKDIVIDFDPYTVPGRARGKLAILRTSKDIYQETCLIFYGQNKFSMSMYHLEQFIRQTGSIHRVQHLSLSMNWGIYHFECLKLVEGFKSLRSLHISLYRAPVNRICTPKRLKSMLFSRPARLHRITTAIDSKYIDQSALPRWRLFYEHLNAWLQEVPGLEPGRG